MNARIEAHVQNRLDNFRTALGALGRFLAESNRGEAAEAGIVQGFEFTFEQCWKLFQLLAEQNALPASSPRAALKAGMKLGFIEDESLWLDMLEQRNLASHTYHTSLAKALVARIESTFFQELRAVTDRVTGFLGELARK
jgi:nucleotidyltransferase substrate binding protein (TIGR01987 family)